VDVDGEGSELVGGPLKDTYRLEQFHCHWGSTGDKGSEHTVDGQSYAAELHLVHWNSSKYANCGEAAGYPDGLAVLGILLKVGAKNPELQKVVDLLPSISHCGDKAVVKEAIDPIKMLPKTFSYWTYLGSLTTPPCAESVTWILFKEPVEVSEDQLAAFRILRYYKRGEECPCDEFNGLQIINHRPPLPLGNRELRECSCD
jgi:carbonic anhydrase